MRVLRVLNNNVVLSREDSGRGVILTGRGIGFRAQPGDEVDPSRIVQVFVPADGRDPDHLAEAFAMIDAEVLRATVIALRETGTEGRESSRPTLAIAVADHVSGALDRLRGGIEIEYPLRAEVQTLYPEEYDKAWALLVEVNRLVDPKLPEHEATALALHLVNAGFSTGDLSFTYTMTGVIQQMLTIVGERYGIGVDRHSMAAARFITHVRYMFVRIQQHRQLAGEQSVISRTIREEYPEATRTAEQLAVIVRLRMGEELTFDEIAYLALHVARMTAEAEAHRALRDGGDRRAGDPAPSDGDTGQPRT
ncbi:PRD domain-containing protein [Brachybacterium aquaticum]|uniref:Beta-glucoside operon transcriptional antiterminator n=1 Tax=Brachybacterium aquaticum TaxID=1432564 RepID=A0A841AIP5_9MICO|nr:PRD domain-containing protein [Brachybacterium aquaticum]MBB5833150.1 beta-glucoside operon transcriptional antiterminator [Brachybacterium aquaticum]